MRKGGARFAKGLLVVSHSGGGLFSLETGETIARDEHLSYPVGNKVEGIGPCENTILTVTEKNYKTEDAITIYSPDQAYKVISNEGLIEIFKKTSL